MRGTVVDVVAKSVVLVLAVVAVVAVEDVVIEDEILEAQSLEYNHLTGTAIAIGEVKLKTNKSLFDWFANTKSEFKDFEIMKIFIKKKRREENEGEKKIL